MLERVRALESQLADRSAWDVEKGRYELRTVSNGEAVVYALKPDADGRDVPHWLCPNCFTNGRKSILFAEERKSGGARGWVCTPCKTRVAMYWEYTPSNPG